MTSKDQHRWMLLCNYNKSLMNIVKKYNRTYLYKTVDWAVLFLQIRSEEGEDWPSNYKNSIRHTDCNCDCSINWSDNRSYGWFTCNFMYSALQKEICCNCYTSLFSLLTLYFIFSYFF